MIQTRAEAAGVVVQLQRTAVTQGLLFSGIAAITALSFMTAVIVWIAVAAPPAWRGWALGIVSLALLASDVFSAITAGRRISHDAGVIADFSRGLKLDLAMVSLALKDPDTDDEEKIAEIERAKARVREAAAEKAAAPSTAEGGGPPSPAGPTLESADAAIRAAAPRADVDAAVARDNAVTPDVGPANPATAPAARPGTRGYAFTGGGTYAATEPSAPDASAIGSDGDRPGTRAVGDAEATEAARRRQRHGSA